MPGARHGTNYSGRSCCFDLLRPTGGANHGSNVVLSTTARQDVRCTGGDCQYNVAGSKQTCGQNTYEPVCSCALICIEVH